ncbi:MAG: adenosine deaminase, partial [Pseudomonadota bacterium]
MRSMFRSALLALALLCGPPAAAADWFETFKDTASDDELLRLMTALPKGGDLHNHITGAVHSEWFWDLAMRARERGYRYFTKIKINNCRYGTDEYGPNRYLLLFRTIPQAHFDSLSPCEQAEYVPLDKLDTPVREAWLNALRLDADFEGRAEFFEALWPRIDGMLSNPHLLADLLVENMKAFGAEGLLYLEAQLPLNGMRDPQGEPISEDEVVQILRERLREDDAVATGVTVRFQLAVLRFLPGAERFLEKIYTFVHAHDDFVGVNMVGREDNDKGYPLRFLETLRKLRRTVGDVPLAFHAGEVDEPNEH